MGSGWSDALLPTAFFIVEIAAIWFVSRRIARHVASAPEAGLDRALVGVLLAVIQVVGIVLFLGSVSALHRGPVLALHVVVALLAVYFVPVVDIAVDRKPPRLGWWLPVGLTGLWFALVGAAISINGVSRQAETTHYHLPNVAFWLREGSLRKIPYATAGYFTHTYPSNGELVGLWAILPSHDDRLAYATPLLFAVLGVLAGAVIARELGGRALLGAYASIAVLAAPLFFGSQVHSLLVDWAVTAMVAAGVALALVAARDARTSPGSSGGWRWVVLSAVSFGCAVGTKYTVLPLAAVCVLVLIALQPRSRWAKTLGIAIPCVAALSLFWFVRNWIVIGNPLFPKAVTFGGKTVFGGGESPVTVYQTTLLDHIKARRWWAIGEWFRFVRSLVGLSFLVAVLGSGVSAWLAFRKRNANAIAVVVLIGIGTLFYFATPYTGGGPKAEAFLVSSQIRYFLPVLLIAGAAAGAAAPALVAIVSSAAIVAAARDIVTGGPGYRNDFAPSHLLVVVATGLVIVFGAAVLIWVRQPALAERLNDPRHRSVARAVMAGAAVLGALALVYGVAPSADSDPSASLLSPYRGGEFVMVGVFDVRSVLGTKLDNNVITPGGSGDAHERPYTSPERLDRRIRELHPDLLIVGTNKLAIPEGWRPDASWRRIGTVYNNIVFAPA